MKKLRPKLTYANVVATLALVLALGGGTVYAAGKLKKNSVKSINIAKGAVKTSDIGKNAVTGAKVKNSALTGADVKDGSLTGADLAAAVAASLTPDVTGTATIAGGQPVNSVTEIPVPIAGTTTFTPPDGQVTALAGEVSMDLATTDTTPPIDECSPQVRVIVSDASGAIDSLFLSPFTESSTIVKALDRDAAGPFGLISPGTPLTLTAAVRGDTQCTATSKLNNVVIRVIQFR